MMYVSVNGLMSYFGDIDDGGYDTRLEDSDYASRALEDCESRIAAYIIPNAPKGEEQIAAFCTAVYAQVAYEHNKANQQLSDMPSGMKSFAVNGFTATLENDGANVVSALGISRTAKAVLLRAGLLYRGVDCSC